MKTTELNGRVTRITANNPGVMTGPGTNTYLIGAEDITVIDPGPASDEHISNILKLCNGKLKQILVTHTHPDHSPGAKLLHERTSAPVMGMIALHKKNQDQTFAPNQILVDGDGIGAVDHTLTVVHTPGHASNHLCYVLEEEKMIFTGDHIMNGSTVVIVPPDGDMSQYLNSLGRLKTFDLEYIAPGHGEVMKSPNKVVDWIIDHRLSREKKVINAMEKMSTAKLDVLVEEVYQDVDKGLFAIAKYSLEAHLIKLVAENKVAQRGDEFVWLGEK